jgi:TRAP-type mannitol/chloroaromatic compound transport system substrate-binding protein
MDEEIKGKITDELCSMIAKKPSLLKMFELMDKLYSDVDKLKIEFARQHEAAQPNHLRLLQELTETMLFSLAEIESKNALELKISEQKAMIQQQETQIKEIEEAAQQIAATQSQEAEAVRDEIAEKDDLLKEIKLSLSGFRDLSRAQRWRLMVNEDSILSHLKGVEEKIDLLIKTK